MNSTTALPALVVNTTYRLHPDDAARYKEIAARFARAASQFDGCYFVSVGQDILESSTFHLVEGWRNRDAFDAFTASVDFQSVLREGLRLRVVERFGDLIFVSRICKLDMPY